LRRAAVARALSRAQVFVLDALFGTYWRVKLARELPVAFHSDHDQAGNTSASPLAAFVRFVLGRQLANRELRAREIGVAEGVQRSDWMA